MAIDYPLSTPTSIGFASISFTAENVVAVTTSPFTLSQKVFRRQGQRWGATVSIPPVKRDLAEPWVAFLLSLEGQYGTFLLGDPNAVEPQGVASKRPGVPRIDGFGQTGQTLKLKGLPGNVIDYLKAGDYIQLGSASSASLHKVLEDVDTSLSGTATVSLWPRIRTAKADSSLVVVDNCKGLFRLKNNISQWEINNISSYGITFDCVEAF